jgi:NAD(P)-dependent dehydrogenase (short-subunit alcohol dehydrogenase family)
MTERRFAGKVALVTGAGSGIGAGTSEAFAREGAKVVCANRTLATAETVAAAITAAGGTAVAFQCNVAKAPEVEAAVAFAEERFGRLDILVNNAGVGGMGHRLVDTTEKEFDRMFAVNVRGAWLGMKYGIPAILRAGGGCIVNVASKDGLVALANNGPYAGSKHALLGLTKAAALEHAREGVRINAICPAGVKTRMLQGLIDRYSAEEWQARIDEKYPSGRIATVEEVAETILFLCSDAARNIHGIALPIDGAFTAQ